YQQKFIGETIDKIIYDGNYVSKKNLKKFFKTVGAEIFLYTDTLKTLLHGVFNKTEMSGQIIVIMRRKQRNI
ncbi:unnamed protein product, partial [marine sediment metagenome]